MDDYEGILAKAGKTYEERMAFVLDAVRLMSDTTRPREVGQAFGERAGSLVDRDRLVVLSRRGVPKGKYMVTRCSDWENAPDPWSERDKLPVLEGGLLGQLIYGNEPVCLEDFQIDPADPGAEFFEGMHSLIAAPQYDRRECMTMTVFMSKDPHGFDPRIMPDLVWTTNLIGKLIHNLRLGEELEQAYATIDHDLMVVAELQRSLLPKKLPDIPGVQIDVYYETAARAGGDYYDFFRLGENRWGILVADVSGHGTPAAVLMAITHSLTRAFTGSKENPAELMNYLNDALYEHYTSESRSFVTAFYGVYQSDFRELTYCCAGHPPPRLKRKSDGIVALDMTGNLPLGVQAHVHHETTAVDLAPGDTILLYTDGITEALDAEGTMLGTDQLDKVLARAANGDPEDVVESILHAVAGHVGHRQPEDDRTVLCLTFSEEAEEEEEEEA